MLVTMKEILEDASKNNYGVIAPNLFTEVDARAYITAAEELHSPLILDIGIGNTKDISLIGSYISKIADQSFLPIAVNLDHGGSASKTFEQVSMEIMSALGSGYSAVMIDRSSLPYEENVQETAILTKMAHAKGLSVEAELGHVGSAADGEEEKSSQFTDPEVAKDFVERTGVDCLAVAVGTAHGLYKKTPELQFDLIQRIKEAVDGLPLVVHGGSGSGHENLKKACHCGINKVNISYEIFSHACECLQKQDFSGLEPYNLYSYIQKAEIETVTELIKVFGSENKAWKPEKKYYPMQGRLLDFVKDSI